MPSTDSPTYRDDTPSKVCVRRPSVMLVRVEPDDEASLGLDQLPVRVLRVRHPLPACTRMRILRPEVLLVGPTVHPRDIGLLTDAAYDIAAGILHVGPFIGREGLHAWVVRTLGIVQSRRAERAA